MDITNVVMLEQGQPLHAFDADALEQLTGSTVTAASFGLRQAREGEAFVGLDERELSLDPRAQVVTCHDLPIALAGVMAQGPGVSADRRIWLESAMFSPASVRTTARSVGLRTDASAFREGSAQEMTLACSIRAQDLLKQLFPCEAKGFWVCGETSGDAARCCCAGMPCISCSAPWRAMRAVPIFPMPLLINA